MFEMSRFQKDIKKAKNFLKDEDYEMCSLLCGVRIELLFKKLIQSCEDVKIYLENAFRKSIDNMTLFEIFSLKQNQLDKIFISPGELKLIDLNAIRLIRNQTYHNFEEDENIKETNAHTLYGALRRFYKAAGLFSRNEKEGIKTEDYSVAVIPPGKKEEKKPNIVLPEKQSTLDQSATLFPSLKEVTFYKNKSSGLYFIYLEDVDNKVRLINPKAEILLLDPKLFVEVFYEDEHKLLRDNLITRGQLDLYRELEKKLKTKVGDKRSIEVKRPTSEFFEYKVHNARARMTITPSGLYRILAGSTAIEEEKGSIPENIKRLRKEFIRNGTVEVDKVRGLLRFVKNGDFSSPSAASGFISGTSTDGWKCFKISKNK